jgi:exonuclease SbcC
VKPLSLKISGFRSHLDTTELSFEGRTLTAIVGPTGAGKSSILEAISYALYGKTPREQRSVKRLICSRGDVARVEFRFLIDDREYEIVRVLRRTGAGQHILQDVSSGEKISGEVAVSNHVVELLGLGFDAFCSSVLLAQGQFSKFLQATPKDRGVILKGIFRLDQIDELQRAAKARRDSLEGDLKLIEGERNAIPEDVALILKRARSQEKEASARARTLEQAIPKEKAILKDLSDAERRRTDADAALVRVTKLTARLPDEVALEELTAEAQEFEARLGEVTAELGVAEEAHRAALNQGAALEEAIGSEVGLVEARAHVRARDGATHQIAELNKQRNQETRAQKAAASTQARAQQLLSHASEALRTISEQQLALRQRHAAHDLRAVLVPGEPCPVCAQTVLEVPSGEPPAELDEIERLREEAVKAQTVAVAGERAAALEAGRLDAALQSSSRSLATLEQEFDRYQRELTMVFGSTGVSLDEIEARLGQIKAARTLVDATREAVAKQRARVEKLESDSKAFEKRYREQGHKLIELFAQLDLPAPAMDGSSESLTVHRITLRDELERRIEEARVALRSSDTDLTNAQRLLQGLRSELGLAPESLIESVFADARSAAEVARNEAATAEKQLARSKELGKEEKTVKARQGLFKVLATDLTAQQFIAFLLEERTRLLLELGSERLHTMTSNRYRLELDDKNDLEVVDELDADKRRSVDTLSGGETFLASLALAIALAEVVTRAGGRLQCFFLDEGFGTLDPESFDLAMDGIERIVGEGRLIGLVSHVPALRDRIEDQIVLEKGEDGMSRIASGGAR